MNALYPTENWPYNHAFCANETSPYGNEAQILSTFATVITHLTPTSEKGGIAEN
ncbi:hypothetical protein PQ465_00290 [Sphingobacterium oryzagri]|uniref:Uncharacterized protein n=1 Tax=Sphingobacterium oryzagri TaxID=3025669 RepID=A0ABY7WH18_9SPHI|nr:hypothetical protein [Sphingobacterium sp. KACC 22765]WDF68837.1 hypothetical protein PQ465_00290 [Sphingobacterium sp. KACC 22765]